MRKLLTCFFAIMVVAPSAFAADGAVSRVQASGTDGRVTNETGRTGANSSRATSRPGVTTVAEPASTNTIVRSTVSRVFTGESETPAPNIVSRTGSNVVPRASTLNRNDVNAARSNLEETVKTVGRNQRVSSASINSDPAVRRAGLVLRPSTAEVGGRATIDEFGTQTGSNIDEAVRNRGFRAAAVTAESIAQATEKLEQTAALNKSCQDQYNECMDQFCAVIDANQGRCSCSSNLSKYTKVEDAVKDANTQLNEVAQRIRYVGLSADEIRAIMTETEAEAALNGTQDTSETRNMLAEIEDLIRDPVSATATYSADATLTGLDMELDFSADGDMFSLDFLDTGNTSSFSNLRGAELYKAARSRCNTVLQQCKSAGATTTQITGNYDLAIDKDCIAYEQGLTKMNETLVSNVRSANRMLQKARLAVLQNKNQYDAKGCIGALETCMKDDMVCGDNYYKCVDPTKKYIDENGQVVLGQNISKITDFMETYNNASVAGTGDNNQSFLETAYAAKIDDDCTDGSCIAKYLLQKIGTKQNVTDEGLCRAVLDKCQAYTYNGETYKPYNDVVVNYIQRAMVNIRAAQRNIIAEYASSCMLDIANCYNQQVTQINSWSTSANVSNIAQVMRGACKNVALTCAYAIDDTCDVDSTDVNSTEIPCSKDDDCGPGAKCVNNKCATSDTNKCINFVSEMFYQSLLCPDHSTYIVGGKDDNNNSSIDEWANNQCACDDGYMAYSGSCIACSSDNNETLNTSGKCVCENGSQRNKDTGACEHQEDENSQKPENSEGE